MNLRNRAFINAVGQQREVEPEYGTTGRSAPPGAGASPSAGAYGYYRLELPAPPVLFEGASGMLTNPPEVAAENRPQASPQERSRSEIESLVAVLQQQVAGLQTTAEMVNRIAATREMGGVEVPESTVIDDHPSPHSPSETPVAVSRAVAPQSGRPATPPLEQCRPASPPSSPHSVREAGRVNSETTAAPFPTAYAAQPLAETLTPPSPRGADTAGVKPISGEFRAVWEVDRYLWPSITDELRQVAELTQAADAIRRAARAGQSAIGITSMSRGEGRTVLSLCLAREAAFLGLRVALVDADPASPQLAPCLGMEEVCGWEDFAAGSIPLSEAAISSLQDAITLVPLRREAARRGFTVTRARLTNLVEHLSASHDLVLLDCGPLSECRGEADCLSALPAALLVADCHRTTARHIQEAATRIQSMGVELLGVVQNFLARDAAA